MLARDGWLAAVAMRRVNFSRRLARVESKMPSENPSGKRNWLRPLDWGRERAYFYHRPKSPPKPAQPAGFLLPEGNPNEHCTEHRIGGAGGSVRAVQQRHTGFPEWCNAGDAADCAVGQYHAGDADLCRDRLRC